MTYVGRSADYAWQLFWAACAIVVSTIGILELLRNLSKPILQAMNIPLGSFLHTRALLVCLTYLSSRLAPPGSQTSLWGLLTIPVVYFPYALIAMDFFISGPSAAAISVTGAVVGHLWWWGVHDTRALRSYASAPTWLSNWIDGPRRPEGARSSGGVHVVPPRRREEPGAPAGHSWGSGQRLGS